MYLLKVAVAVSRGSVRLLSGPQGVAWAGSGCLAHISRTFVPIMTFTSWPPLPDQGHLYQTRACCCVTRQQKKKKKKNRLSDSFCTVMYVRCAVQWLVASIRSVTIPNNKEVGPPLGGFCSATVCEKGC